MKECPACRRCFPDHVNHCPNDGDPTTQSIAGEPMLDGRYQLERRLGAGGMGVVFQARHIFLKTAHAIKVILPDLVGNDPMLVTRFRQEALAAAAIRHPNIIAVTDFGVARGTMPFLVMEFVKGRSLHEILAAEGPLAPARALELMSAIGSGVAAAHRQNIVHRDLKPLNIMIQEEMTPAEGLKILDFGLAKIKSGELLGSFVQAKTSGLMGSPFYMAPEQWSDEEPDARADIYSLGVILYQMLGGDVPFKGTGIPSIMKKHLTAAPPTLSSLGVHVPPAIEAVVRHALEKEAGNRPQTVDAFVRELRDAVAQTSASLDRTQVGSMGAQSATIISPSSPSIQTPSASMASLSQQTTTTLRVRTNPPHSRVYINNISVGTSDGAGDFIINEVQRGTHTVRVAHDGYAEWSRQIECSGGVCNVDAQLQSLMATSLPQMSGDQMAGTISANALDPADQQGYASMMEVQRLRAQAAALEDQARRDAE
ncbi:MAG: serine/threonine-protein kinase, partial [Pyrinomonadaceae bacterium]